MRKPLHISILTGLLLLLHACMYDPIPELTDEAPLMLNVQLTTQAAGTRASGDALEDALDAEDFIDIVNRDYQILVFDGNGRFIQNLTVTQQRLSATDEKNKYIVALSGPLSVSEGSVQVLVLTNWKGFDAEAAYPELTNGTLVDDLYKEAAKNCFTMPTHTAADGALESWQPKLSESGIPMFGVSATVPLSNAVEATDSDLADGVRVNGKVLDMGEIKMLRAIARIEVRLFGSDPSLNGLRLADVSLSTFNTTGRFIPDVKANASWNNEQVQVSSPTLPTAVAQSSSALHFFAVSDFCMRAYVPEMDLAAVRPEIGIRVADAEGSDRTFTLALDDPKPNNTLNHLLRNHIYRYTITRVEVEVETDAHLTAIVDVDPWDEGDLNPEFGLGDSDGITDNDPWDEGELNPDLGLADPDGIVDVDSWDEGPLNPSFGLTDTENKSDAAVEQISIFRNSSERATEFYHSLFSRRFWHLKRGYATDENGKNARQNVSQ